MSYWEQYQNFTDEELISRINSNDQEAVDYLMDKYKNLVRQKARTLFLIDGDQDDLIQEGMIGLYKAIRDYKKEKEGSFATFASLCVSRQMYNAIKASNRKKNIPLNTYISFYTPMSRENMEQEENAILVDSIYQQNFLDPEKLVIDKESTSMIKYELVRRLSPMEYKVLNFYLEGLAYTEISKVLNKSPKSIDNALQRIKSKLGIILREKN